MNKMKLNLNQLKVESFETKENNKTQGTVKGHVDLSDQYWCEEESGYKGCWSWEATCAPSCQPTCHPPACE